LLFGKPFTIKHHGIFPMGLALLGPSYVDGNVETARGAITNEWTPVAVFMSLIGWLAAALVQGLVAKNKSNLSVKLHTCHNEPCALGNKK
jgi:hypothetical protein